MPEGSGFVNRGILSRSATVIVPVAQAADRLHLSYILRWTVLAGVRGYQRYLSPYKGFSCAHSRVYGGVSCSEYLRRSVQNNGLAEALPRFQKRLRACKEASHILSLPHAQKRRKKREALGDCGAGWCDISCIPLDFCDVFELCDLDCDGLGDLDGCGDCGGCDCG